MATVGWNGEQLVGELRDRPHPVENKTMAPARQCAARSSRSPQPCFLVRFKTVARKCNTMSELVARLPPHCEQLHDVLLENHAR